MSITMINVGLPHPLWKPQAESGGAFNDDLGLLVIGLPQPTPDEDESPNRLLGLGAVARGLRHREVLGGGICFHAAHRSEHQGRCIRTRADPNGLVATVRVTSTCPAARSDL